MKRGVDIVLFSSVAFTCKVYIIVYSKDLLRFQFSPFCFKTSGKIVTYALVGKMFIRLVVIFFNFKNCVCFTCGVKIGV